MKQMRIAIFSDIHGNIYAFKEMLKSMAKASIDRYYFCGDICGYYYHQNEVIDHLRGMNNLECVIGNHDKIFLDILHGKMSGDNYSKKYGKSIEKLKETISKENLDFLEGLKDTYYSISENIKIAMFHGSPWDSLNEYCYPDSEVSRYENLKYDYIFLGHTHYRMHKIIRNKNIVNPGSIGQPRDGKLPSYALIDTSQKKVEFVSVKYDVEKLIRDIKEVRDEPSYLIDVLRRVAQDGQ